MNRIFTIKSGIKTTIRVNFNTTKTISNVIMGLKLTNENSVLIKILGTFISNNIYEIVINSEDNKLSEGIYNFDLKCDIDGIEQIPLSGHLVVLNTVFENQINIEGDI